MPLDWAAESGMRRSRHRRNLCRYSPQLPHQSITPNQRRWRQSLRQLSPRRQPRRTVMATTNLVVYSPRPWNGRAGKLTTARMPSRPVSRSGLPERPWACPEPSTFSTMAISNASCAAINSSVLSPRTSARRWWTSASDGWSRASRENPPLSPSRMWPTSSS